MTFTLDDLERVIANRATASPAESYTARLMAEGVAKCAQKLGEEAVETAIAAVKPDREELIRETADLFYHLLVTLRASGVDLSEVYEELGARQHRQGLAEAGIEREADA